MYISIVNRLKKFIEFVKKKKKSRKCDWQYVTAIKTSFRYMLSEQRPAITLFKIQNRWFNFRIVIIRKCKQLFHICWKKNFTYHIKTFETTLASWKNQSGCPRFYSTVNTQLLCVHPNMLPEVCINWIL